MPRRRTLVTLLLGAVILAGCSDSEDPQPAAAAADRIADLDPDAMDLVRVDFCDLVTPKAVRAALRGPSSATESWGNGEKPPLEDAASDITHEFGCSWTRGGGYAARAWVFARPVTPAFAERVVRSAAERPRCTTRGTTDFGAPSVLQVCSLPGKRSRVRHAGLFGDTWVTCEIAGPAGRAAPRQRADTWCARVVSALDARR